MFRLAVKSVRHNPKRLILTAVAVALGVSLVAASHTFTNALSSGFSELFSDIYAGTDVIVEPDPDAGTEDVPAADPFGPGEGMFTQADADAISAVDGVDHALGGLQAPGSVLGPDTGEPLDPLMAGGAPSQIFNWTDVPGVDQSEVVDGRGPEANGEIILDVDSIPRLGYKLGDQVRIATESGVTEYELVGSVRFGESNSLQGATLAFLTLDDASELVGSSDFQQISVITAEGADNDAVATAIQEV